MSRKHKIEMIDIFFCVYSNRSLSGGSAESWPYDHTGENKNLEYFVDVNLFLKSDW